MAFQALEFHLMAGEHPRVGRPMCLMTALTALHPHRRVLEGERTALISVAAQAARFVRRNLAQRIADQAPVRVVAVDAVDSTLLQAMPVGPLKLCQDGNVTCSALGRLLGRLRLVHHMTTGAGHLVPGMTAPDGAHAGGLVHMALQTGAI